MMERLMERAEQIARARLTGTAEAVAASIREALPSGSVQVEDGDVVISARGLLKKWLSSAQIRFLSSAAR